MNRPIMMASLAGALWLAACGKESHETAAPDAGPSMALEAPSASIHSAPSASASATATEVPDEPPTERRAERKAATEITRSNYKTELSKIEKEVGSP